MYLQFQRAAAMAVVAYFAFPSLAVAQTPVTPKREWKRSDWKQLGERKIQVGFTIWGPRPIVEIALSADPADKKSMRISRLKVTILDSKGKPLEVKKYYQDGTMLFGRDFHVAHFKVGTFVQNIQPEEVSTVTVEGFGGKVVTNFVDGRAQDDTPPN